MPFDPAQDLAQLKSAMCRNSVRVGEFTLVSGEKSTVYVDSKLTTLRAEAIPLIGRVILRKFKERGWRPDAIGGLTLGADPIALAVACESVAEAGHPINAFVVRKETKKHGTMRFIEGLDHTEGVKAVVVEDVCSKGGSAAQAVERALEAGMDILGVICLVDREMGGPELLKEKFGLSVERIFTLAELVAAKG
jgi:orotate phosphoribosyltransferase